MSMPVLTAPNRIRFVPVEAVPRQAAPAATRVASPPIREPRSYSQIRRYAQCPLQWHLARLYSPAFTPASLVFGGAFHAAAEAYYRARRDGAAVGAEDLLAAYERHWAREAARGPIRYTAKLEDAVGIRDLARRMLEAFLAAARPGEIVAVEEPFAIDLAPGLPTIRGRIDMIEVRTDADGVRRVHLVDLKTMARKPSWDDLDTDQSHLYALAARRLKCVQALGLPLALRFTVVTKTKVPEVVEIPVEPSSRATERAVEKLRQCDRAMRAGITYPVPGWTCSACGYAQACRQWPQLSAHAKAASHEAAA